MQICTEFACTLGEVGFDPPQKTQKFFHCTVGIEAKDFQGQIEDILI